MECCFKARLLLVVKILSCQFESNAKSGALISKRISVISGNGSMATGLYSRPIDNHSRKLQMVEKNSLIVARLWK